MKPLRLLLTTFFAFLSITTCITFKPLDLHILLCYSPSSLTPISHCTWLLPPLSLLPASLRLESAHPLFILPNHILTICVQYGTASSSVEIDIHRLTDFRFVSREATDSVIRFASTVSISSAVCVHISLTVRGNIEQ